jgi:GH43 family beta-xylosidase
MAPSLLLVGWRSISVLLATILCLVSSAAAQTRIRTGSDPSVMKVGDTYYSADTDGAKIYVHVASTLEGLTESAESHTVWTNAESLGAVWAPEITVDGGTTYIYFSAGAATEDHRMYWISASSPIGTYSSVQKLNLPDDHWAIDGTMFTYEGQRWFVWSGWEGTTNGEQSLFICKMSSPTDPTGARYIISQPRETWEEGDSPTVNEGPEAIIDPNGQLHIVYSANGSWNDKYCLADLRLKSGGDPTYVWDWYKSNGCLFGSHQDRMMTGWDETLYINGPGHHTFALTDGDIENSPEGTTAVPFVFHGVIKGTTYSWGARAWYKGSWMWWASIAYTRSNVPGDISNTGYSLKFFE